MKGGRNYSFGSGFGKLISGIYLCTSIFESGRFKVLKIKYWSVRLGVRTPGFHPGNRGSIPLRTALQKPGFARLFSFVLRGAPLPVQNGFTKTILHFQAPR